MAQNPQGQLPGQPTGQPIPPGPGSSNNQVSFVSCKFIPLSKRLIIAFGADKVGTRNPIGSIQKFRWIRTDARSANGQHVQ